VWENEPTPDPALIAQVKIATPHIAGYSFDGKTTGTRMMYEAVCRFLDADAEPAMGLFNIPVDNSNLDLVSTGREALREAVFRAYPIQEDDGRMRELTGLPEDERGDRFDRLRKEYPVRREFHQYRVSGRFLTEEDRTILKNLGFGLA
jgi:erythronate-4-phosphate dehydrogenase